MILYFSGSDAYKINKKVKEIKDKFHKEVDPSGLNIVEILENKSAIIRQEITSSPFLAKRKLIIVKNIFTGKVAKELSETLEEILEKDTTNPDSNIIVITDIILDEKKKDTAIQKKFKSTKFAQEFLQPKPFEVPAYIMREVQEKGGSILRAEAEYLASIIGNDTVLISNEIEKLLSAQNVISKDLINALSSRQFQDDIFVLIDAISTKNKQKSLNLVEDFFALGNDEHYLFAMILRQWKILLQIKSLQTKNPRIGSDQISLELSIHPYVAKKTIPLCNSFTEQQLKNTFDKLAKLDERLKVSFADPELLIEELVTMM